MTSELKRTLACVFNVAILTTFGVVEIASYFTNFGVTSFAWPLKKGVKFVASKEPFW